LAPVSSFASSLLGPVLPRCLLLRHPFSHRCLLLRYPLLAPVPSIASSVLGAVWPRCLLLRHPFSPRCLLLRYPLLVPVSSIASSLLGPYIFLGDLSTNALSDVYLITLNTKFHSHAKQHKNCDSVYFKACSVKILASLLHLHFWTIYKSPRFLEKVIWQLAGVSFVSTATVIHLYSFSNRDEH
jgi:hypothetical protein